MSATKIFDVQNGGAMPRLIYTPARPSFDKLAQRPVSNAIRHARKRIHYAAHSVCISTSVFLSKDVA